MNHDDNNQEHVMLPPRPLKAQKGRGAVSNLQGRFEVNAREAYDDGWEREEEEASPWKTQVTDEYCKSILSRNASPDLPFSVSLNPYRGCEHGCIYCFARPTHSYLGLSPGMDFESKIFAKVNAPEMLRRELAKAGYEPESIALGVNTDAYQPCERERKLTRRVLEVLQECQHPVGLITKSSLIERDIDILAAMAAKRQAGVAITLTTLDPAISRTLEPRAAAPARRLRTIRTLTDAGIPVAVSVAPIIPFITEPDIERLLEAVKEAGAVTAHYTVLRLPWEVAPLFQQWLQAHFPERAQRVMNRVREMRGGKDYDSNFATRMKGEGVWAELIRQRFKIATERLGLSGQGSRFHSMDASQFTRPLVVPPLGARAKPANEGQLDLF
ncbi:DNA repair photolyase [Duganella sp. 1411]|uniref:PA0069 family radical SAM protein n=1 Tax=unclassified Duganella TaxID=2636909 RepID=UPI001AE44CFD|nr:PA0069 family radical SAM protein [Duganella sp. 1411]MBP1203929.1 DNA repair photolyase [Duganella sp. 1411]